MDLRICGFTQVTTASDGATRKKAGAALILYSASSPNRPRLDRFPSRVQAVPPLTLRQRGTPREPFPVSCTALLVASAKGTGPQSRLCTLAHQLR